MKRALIGLVGASATLIGCGSSAPTPTVAASVSAGPQSATPVAARRSTACAADEQTLFACRMKGGERLAVCGAKNGQGKSNVQYRFGGDRPDLTLDGGRFASVAYSGGGEAQIAFARGGNRYIVYSRTVRTDFTAGESNDPKSSDGVMVLRGDDMVEDRHCTEPAQTPVDIEAGARYGDVADDLFHYPD